MFDCVADGIDCFFLLYLMIDTVTVRKIKGQLKSKDFSHAASLSLVTQDQIVGVIRLGHLPSKLGQCKVKCKLTQGMSDIKIYTTGVLAL